MQIACRGHGLNLIGCPIARARELRREGKDQGCSAGCKSRWLMQSVSTVGVLPLELCRSILNGADELGRDLTAGEFATIEDTTKAIGELDRKIASGKHDLSVLAQARDLTAEFGPPVGADGSASWSVA